MPAPRIVLTAGAIAASTALVLSGCGGGASASGSGQLRVVTSTNVYADLVSQVAGDRADVTSIIDDPNQDPHSYEATTHDRLWLSKADLVVENGGGYDSFMTTMLNASGVEVTTIDTVAISGLPGSQDLGNESHDHEEGHDSDGQDQDEDEHDEHEHGSFNEHLWYSVPTMVKLVDEVQAHLGEAMPEHKDEFAANAKDYESELEKLQSDIDAVQKDHGGEKVAVTEPVPLRLFDDMGLENITSAQFLAAVEEGNDVPPLVLKAAQSQISDGEAVLLGFNPQAAGPQAEALKSTAETSEIPIINLGETMPEGEHYLDWMGGHITDISTALEGHKH